MLTEKRAMMSFRRSVCHTVFAIVAVLGFVGLSTKANPQVQNLEAVIDTPTGKGITPTAARGSIFQDLNPGLAQAPQLRPGHAAAVAVSPNGKMLAIETSGFNMHFDNRGKPILELSKEYLFLFDISGAAPRQTQVFPVDNTFQGLAWGLDSAHVYVAGGPDDLVYEFVQSDGRFSAGRSFKLGHSPFTYTSPKKPLAGALAVSPDGARLLVANVMHDSVSLIDLNTGRVVGEQDLRPGKIDPTKHGHPGGTYPRSIAWTSDQRAYVASERDRELIALNVRGFKMSVGARVPVHGQPTALVASRDGSRLYAALDNTDQVAVIDPPGGRLLEQFEALTPESVYVNKAKLGGANSNGLALTPDEATLLVSNGGQNSVAVVQLGTRALPISVGQHAVKSAKAAQKDLNGDGDVQSGDPATRSAVVGLIPTGWYPTGVAVSHDGSHWYVVNGKSPTGPNGAICGPDKPIDAQCIERLKANEPDDWQSDTNYTIDQSVIQLEKAGLLTFPAPGVSELARLTNQVAHNNGFDRPDKLASDRELLAFLHQRIKHIVYIIKENRSYDQLFGDLELGNGDPRLAVFGKAITPNHHALALNSVVLDNFVVSGEGSWSGWQWGTAGRTNDFTERNDFIALAGRGGDYACVGVNRGLNTALSTSRERHEELSLSPTDPDILPGTRDVAELDGPGDDPGAGYIWDSVLRAGLKVRNYGFFGGFNFGPDNAPTQDPFSLKQQFIEYNGHLRPFTDVYYRGFDLRVPDYWRYHEWRREFDQFVKSGELPSLSLIALGGDHTGDFAKAIDGVNTPETQVADNDYALGRIVESVANSPFAKDTLIIAIEDDTWNGFDHVDAFRSPIEIAGPYVRRHALVSTRYSMVNVIKSILEILGADPIGINDALAAPMSDVFDRSSADWSYQASVPNILYSTQLPLPPRAANGQGCLALPKHDAAYWANAMEGRDYSLPDAGDFGVGNRALWKGLKGEAHYPAVRDGADLRHNRAPLLARSKSSDASRQTDRSSCSVLDINPIDPRRHRRRDEMESGKVGLMLGSN
jgi:DNA-binding beta-propeller fold protein YncE